MGKPGSATPFTAMRRPYRAARRGGRMLIDRLNQLLFTVDRVCRRAPKKQVIICGYSRGGTSLFYNMMSATVRGFKCGAFEPSGLKYLKCYGNLISKKPLDL